MTKDSVLRIGVYNNFNFTREELDKVAEVVSVHDCKPFVNSNSLVTISAEYPSILTINPYLKSFVVPVGDLSNVKACRVKWIHKPKADPGTAQMEAIQWCVENNIPILLTFMRFRRKATLERFVQPLGIEQVYSFRAGYYRAGQQYNKGIVEYLKEMTERPDLIFACDLEEKGCPACMNCSKLTYGTDEADINSLSLSCSGDNGRCLFNCPDCWAKTIISRGMVSYDKITKNSKQKGKKDA